jgi:hypothetical protein
MFHHLLHRSFSLSDFVADVQETIKPVLTAYSKVTLVLIRRNSFFGWTSKIADCPNGMVWLYITSLYIFWWKLKNLVRLFWHYRVSDKFIMWSSKRSIEILSNWHEKVIHPLIYTLLELLVTSQLHILLSGWCGDSKKVLHQGSDWALQRRETSLCITRHIFWSQSRPLLNMSWIAPSPWLIWI